MNAYEFALQCVESKAVLTYESFTNRAIKAILDEDMKQDKFLDTLSDFKSFEGLNHKYIVNFSGAWRKYALNDSNDKLTANKLTANKLIINILGQKFERRNADNDIELGLISPDIYNKINWDTTNLDLDKSNDYSSHLKYMIVKCKRTRSNNSTHDVQIVLLRPKDFLQVITTSRCTNEYQRYFITLAEIHRAYQETYLQWLINYKDSMLDEQSKKIDILINDNRRLIDGQQKLLSENKKQSAENKKQSAEIQALLANSRHIIAQNDDQSREIKQLHIKIDTIFEYLLSFARMTIPTWIGSSVIKKQYDTLLNNKTSLNALQHLKVLFMVGFYMPMDEYTNETKIVNDETISFTGKANMLIYACCTNFADVRKRIKELYMRHDDADENDNNHISMYMCKPLVITLISCEVNLERIILENTNIFPLHSISTWDSKYKRWHLTVNSDTFDDVNELFADICAKATLERFQGYQIRINEFNNANNNDKIDPNIIEYLTKVDNEFYSSTKPFCQRYLDSYSKVVYDNEGQAAEYKFSRSSNLQCIRNEYSANLRNTHYNLRKIQDLILDSTKVDHIKIMGDQGILSKDDLPALKALAKFEEIDVSELKPPSDYESD